MSIIAAEVARLVLGPVASGPAGFGVFHEVNSSVNMNVPAGTSATVNADLNSSSLARAQTHNSGGKERFAKLRAAEPKTAGSRSTISATSRNDKSDVQYLSMFSKQPGLERSVNKVMDRAPQSRRDVRSAFANGTTTAKSPHERVRQKHFARVARELANTPKQKPVQLNPERLPDGVKQQIVEAAMAKGQEATPFGNTPLPRRQSYAALRKSTPETTRKSARPRDKHWAGMVVAPGFVYA